MSLLTYIYIFHIFFVFSPPHQVTPITRTNVKVEWSPLNEEDFNGDACSGGYQAKRIIYIF